MKNIEQGMMNAMKNIEQGMMNAEVNGTSVQK